MYFESRGKGTIMAQYGRTNHIIERFSLCLTDFIFSYIATEDFRYKSEVMQGVICLIGEVKKEFSSERKIVNGVLLPEQETVENMKAYLINTKEPTALLKLKNLLSKLEYNSYKSTLDQKFNICLDDFLEEVDEHLIDLKDIKDGKPIKRISTKIEIYKKISESEQREWEWEQRANAEALRDMYALGAFADE